MVPAVGFKRKLDEVELLETVSTGPQLKKPAVGESYARTADPYIIPRESLYKPI